MGSGRRWNVLSLGPGKWLNESEKLGVIRGDVTVVMFIAVLGSKAENPWKVLVSHAPEDSGETPVECHLSEMPRTKRVPHFRFFFFFEIVPCVALAGL